MLNKTMTRRGFVATTATALGALVLSGCATSSQNTSAGSDSGKQTSQPKPSDTASPDASDGTASGKSILVACFSATGNTRAVAQMLSQHLGADYFEIEAADPYSETDLDYSDETNRATAEQHDSTMRPALASIPDFAAYNVILLGHPIWWGKAPRLICTLLESTDISGKKVAEFCTSGDSDIEDAFSELKGLVTDAEWIGAMRFAAGASKSEVTKWADSLSIR